MSIDKFGRHSIATNAKGDQSSQSRMFFLTAKGNLDANAKIIHNLRTPRLLSDAITKKLFRRKRAHQRNQH